MGEALKIGGRRGAEVFQSTVGSSEGREPAVIHGGDVLLSWFCKFVGPEEVAR